MIGGLGAGVVCALGIARLALWTLQAAWPEYAAALPQKEFTLPMLLSRLSIAVLLTVAAASAATLVAGDRRASWMLGCLIVVVSLPSHLHYSWADYPLWYHAVYLVSIVPLAVLGGRLVPIRLSSPTPVTPRSVKRGNMSQIRIRAERQADHERVFEIEQSAFGGQIQANLVEALRESANPSLSLVADLNHKIVFA